MIAYPTLEQALADCSRMGLRARDPGLLDSALHRPHSRFGGRDIYPTVPLKAAALLHSPVRNHPLVDGNKRLAWLVTVIFLDLNGWRATLSTLEAAQLVLRVVVDHELTLGQTHTSSRLPATRTHRFAFWYAGPTQGPGPPCGHVRVVEEAGHRRAQGVTDHPARLDGVPDGPPNPSDVGGRRSCWPACRMTHRRR